MEIDYQALVNQYYQNLQDNLRHFKGGPGFLESWALDEDHDRGLLEILDLSRGEDLDELRIRLPENLAVSLDFLRTETAAFGSLSLEGSCLIFRPSPGPAYRAALRARKLTHLGAAAADSLVARESGGELSVRINGEGFVESARHLGWSGITSALLDQFCELLENRPLQEGAEHGVVRLENTLRDFRKPAPVKGLVTTENADACFALPLRLIRSIWASHSGASAARRNTWRDEAPPAWRDAAESTRLEEARRLVGEGIAALGLPATELVALRGVTRLTLAPLDKLDKAKLATGLIQLERWLRSASAVPFELQLESIEDRNRRETRRAPPVAKPAGAGLG